jgi:endonuclease G
MLDTSSNRETRSFMIPNEATDKPLEEFLTTTKKIERYAGLVLWQRLVGKEIENEKNKIRPMWK